MRNGMFPLILIFLLGCIAWTAWRFWQILPFSGWGKSLCVSLYILCFLVIFPHFAWGDRMPMWLATATYEAGTSWMIFFVYALLLFALLALGRLVHLVLRVRARQQGPVQRGLHRRGAPEDVL